MRYNLKENSLGSNDFAISLKRLRLFKFPGAIFKIFDPKYILQFNSYYIDVDFTFLGCLRLNA